ncbi:MAG: hypothetical protein II863_07220, partial [Kiritimatiellae bacterium]|nr:hypothetical protein [Kiritimatiellia bacterium]
IIATVEAQKANTNGNNNASGGTNGLFNAGGPSTFPNHGPLVPQQNGMAAMMQHSALLQRLQHTGVPTLTTNDLINGYCVLAETFSPAVELPTNAVPVGNWHIHGTSSPFGANKTDFPGFPFPFGTNEVMSSDTWFFQDGKIRADLRDAGTEIDSGIGDVSAVQGESMLARSEGEDGEQTMWWWHFYALPNTNEPVTAAITLYPDGCFALLTNDIWRICAPVRPLEWLTISAPSVIMRNGETNIVSVALSAPYNVDALPTIECIGGANHVSIETIDAQTLSVRGISTSDTIDDVTFAASVTICGETFTTTRSLTVASVKYLHVDSPVAGISTNPPPFIGETAYPFSITNSLAPDKHLVVPFCNVATLGENGFSIANFTVYMNLELEPEGVFVYDLPGEWELIEAIPQASGSLVSISPIDAEFRNPKKGGIYRFRGRVGGSPWTEANVVLPVCGAGIEDIFISDLAITHTIMTNLCIKYDRETRNSPMFGLKWFVREGAGDYLGRPDNQQRKTTWLYNQVNDLSGFGAVATFYGYPTRMAKLSNMTVGFGSQLIGVNNFRQNMSQYIGVDNDATATMSWDCGTGLAAPGVNISSNCAACAKAMWNVADDKVKRLWPNNLPADNHDPYSYTVDYNFYFVSPGLIYMGLGEFGF